MRKAILIGAALVALAACNSSGGDEERSGEPRSQEEHEEWRRFVNSEDNAASDSLRDHYVDFSFEYPADWEIAEQPTDGSAQNYVQVSAPSVRGMEPIAFSVGSAYGTGDPATDGALFEGLIEQMSAQFGQAMDDYEMVSSGEQRVGGHDSYGWRFEGSVESREGEPVRVYGRADIVIPEGQENGVFLIAIVSEDANEADDAADIGESGVIEAIHDSFRFD